MSGYPVECMREDIAKVYSSISWRDKVKYMRDDQVRAIYYDFLERGKFNQPKPEIFVPSVKVISEPLPSMFEEDIAYQIAMDI